MKNTLHKKVHTAVTLQEASSTVVLEQIKNPITVIGLHDSGHQAYQDYIEGLDPNDPYDAKILHRISCGN